MGFDAVQLRLATGLTGEDYVKHEAWKDARLPRCPVHPGGGCRLRRHGTYGRVEPAGTKVARYYCPDAHQTFSLLPDCLASRLSSTLVEVEEVALAVEQRRGTVVSVAERLRPDIETQGALRWMRRRVWAVAATLVTLLGLRPDLLAGRRPTVQDFRAALCVDHALPALRETAGSHLASLMPYVGFGPRVVRRARRRARRQHGTGPDPPR
ncbi:MAG: hypothetical protein M0Z88_10000 [Actinomycetota bacterium]|nr:hypothetical protein [Actinomycetota bacterium]